MLDLDEIRRRPDRPPTSHGPVEYHPQTHSRRGVVDFQAPAGQRQRGIARRPPAETARPDLSFALSASVKSIAISKRHGSRFSTVVSTVCALGKSVPCSRL